MPRSAHTRIHPPTHNDTSRSRSKLPSLVLLVLLVAIPATAQPPVRADRAPSATLFTGGSTPRELSIPFSERDGQSRVIVEFNLQPVARSSDSARSIASHEDLLSRFRSDLQRIGGMPAQRSSHGARILREYSLTFSGAAVTLEGSALDALRSLPYVKRVSMDTEVRATAEPGIALIRADMVRSAFAARGVGITVAIIDTGIDYGHAALGGNFGPGFKVVGGWDFVNDDADPIDDNGHGTHVAGIVAANSPELLGVAPDAQLFAYKVLDGSGYGFPSDAIAAIERCADPDGNLDVSDRVDVVNLSLGRIGQGDDSLSDAVDNLVLLGSVVCVAAGDDRDWQSIESPANASEAITVGAIDSHSAIAEFSSRGPLSSTWALKPDVVAPGVGVRSSALHGETDVLSGTSMASAYVAGVAALLRELHPDWTAQQIKSAITTSAEPLSESVMAAGSGRVDALRAASAETLVSPTSISFGRVEPSSGSWSSRRTLTVTNGSATNRSYAVTTSEESSGLIVSVSSPSFSLAAGGSIDLDVTATVNMNALAEPDVESLTYGGFVTIDDGWYATPGALDALRSRNIPATSFLIASPAERAAGYYREIVDLGGTVENHSLTHPQYAKLPRPGQVAEICGNSDRLAATFGRRPLLARPPYGSYNATTNQVFAECGVYANVMWSAEVRQGRLFLDGPGGLQAGDVVLLHYRPETAGDLAVLFAAMDQAGLRAARLQDYLLPKAAQHQRKRHVA